MCNSVRQLLREQQGIVRRGPLTIGDRLPDFCKKAIVSTSTGMEIITLDQRYASSNRKWLIFFWWPKDFTFVCPTEIIDFDRHAAAFAAADALVLGASTDSEYVHLGWRLQHPGLQQLNIPLLADTSKSLATAMGILDEEEKVAYRATFIIDPENTVRHVSLYDMNTGRNVAEVLRVLQALQTEALTPCGWQPGQATVGSSL